MRRALSGEEIRIASAPMRSSRSSRTLAGGSMSSASRSGLK